MTGTSAEVIVAPLSAIPAGEGRAFDIAGERIAIFNTRVGGVFAVQANCPHKGAPLADGLVGGTTVICPLHSWKFDLANGGVLMGDCGLKTYPARMDDQGRVLVTIEEKE
jgi:nitrite reductase (NADH) small subunit